MTCKMPFNRKRIRKSCEIIHGNVCRKAWNEAPYGQEKDWILADLKRRRVERLK